MAVTSSSSRRGISVPPLPSKNSKPASDVAVRRLLRLPLVATAQLLAQLVCLIPLQLLSYHVATARGCPIDKPRNLAKSVTVE